MSDGTRPGPEAAGPIRSQSTSAVSGEGEAVAMTLRVPVARHEEFIRLWRDFAKSGDISPDDCPPVHAQQLYARIKRSSKYRGQADKLGPDPNALFPVEVVQGDPMGYVVQGGPGGQYRLADVRLFVIEGHTRQQVSVSVQKPAMKTQTLTQADVNRMRGLLDTWRRQDKDGREEVVRLLDQAALTGMAFGHAMTMQVLSYVACEWVPCDAPNGRVTSSLDDWHKFIREDLAWTGPIRVAAIRLPTGE